MALETTTFQHGGATFPLRTGRSTSLLLDADPALAATLDYFAWFLNAYCGARWAQECHAIGREDLATGGIVATTVPFEPTDYLGEAQFALPILAVYRMSETYTDHTILRYHSSSKWGVAWVMPPLTPGQTEALYPMARAVSVALSRAVYMGADTNFESGANIWAAANLQDVGFESCQYGRAVVMGSTQLVFPGASMTMTVTERNNDVAGAFDDLAGVDIGEDMTTTDGTTTDLVRVAVTT